MTPLPSAGEPGTGLESVDGWETKVEHLPQLLDSWGWQELGTGSLCLAPDIRREGVGERRKKGRYFKCLWPSPEKDRPCGHLGVPRWSQESETHWD